MFLRPRYNQRPRAAWLVALFGLATSSCGPPGSNPTAVDYGSWSPVELAGGNGGEGPVMPESGPALYVSTSAIELGPAVPRRAFLLRNIGEGTLIYTVHVGAPWLEVDPSSGTNDGRDETIVVSVVAENLPGNEVTSDLTLTTAHGQQHVIFVRYTQSAKSSGDLLTDRDVLRFGPQDVEKTVTVTNLGATDLQYSAVCGADWITVEPADGWLGAEPQQLKVYAERSKLDLGTYSTDLRITTGDGGTTELRVELEEALETWVMMPPRRYFEYGARNLDESSRPNPITGMTMWHYLSIGNRRGEYRRDGTDGGWADPAEHRDAVQDARARGYQVRPGLGRVLTTMYCVKWLRGCRWDENTLTLYDETPYGSFDEAVLDGEYRMLTVHQGTGALLGNYTIVSRGTDWVRLDRSIGAAAHGHNDIWVCYAVPSETYYGHGQAHEQYFDRERWAGAADQVRALIPYLGDDRVLSIDVEPYWHEGDGVGQGIRYPQGREADMRAAMQPLLDVLRNNDITLECWPGVDYPLLPVLAEATTVIDVDEHIYVIYDEPERLANLPGRRTAVRLEGRRYLPAVGVQVLKDRHVHLLSQMHDDYQVRKVMLYLGEAGTSVFTDAWYAAP